MPKTWILAFEYFKTGLFGDSKDQLTYNFSSDIYQSLPPSATQDFSNLVQLRVIFSQAYQYTIAFSRELNWSASVITVF